jgi:hypothetical protein
MYGEVETLSLETTREADAGACGHVDVEDALASLAVEMAMVVHVWTEARRAALQRHLAHDAALDEGIQAIIDGGHGNLRHRRLCAEKHFFGSGMIPLLQ